MDITTTPTPAGLTPQFAKEPPKEILGQKFTLDDVPSSNTTGERVVVEDKLGNQTKVDTAPVTNAPKPEDTKVVDKPKVDSNGEVTVVEKPVAVEQPKKEDKKEEKKEEPSIPKYLKAPADAAKVDTAKKDEKPVDKVAPSLDADKVLRDYTGYSADEVSVLKQMSNDAYKFTTGLIKKSKELETKSSGTYLQHPDAYVLSPEFNQIRATAIQATRESELYISLLEKVRNGEKIQLPERYDAETGQFVMSKGEVEPTSRLEEELRAAALNTRNVADQSKSKLIELQSNFKNQVAQDLANINAYRHSNFDWVKNPELLKYSISCGSMGDRTLQQIRDDIKGVMPSYMQSHPLADVVGDMMIALRLVNAELAEAKSGQQVAEIKKEEALRKEPTSDHRFNTNGNGKAVGGVTTFDTVGMPRG